ncbi:MAG TPA: DUF3368 domain-containing protein [Polyangiaceae bacterium]
MSPGSSWEGVAGAVLGPLGVLLAAKRKRLIAEVRPIILRMEALGMFVSSRVREDVLRLAGETST